MNDEEPPLAIMGSTSSLKTYLSYDPSTGDITWKKGRGRRAKIGTKAGYLDSYGYLCIGLKGKYYKAHRVAWLLFYGRWPKDQLDHINQIKADNRIVNLREADNSLNQRNTGVRKDNTSGLSGVNWDIAHCLWIARIMIEGKRVYLGGFKSLFEAAAIRKSTENIHGYR